MKSEQDMGHSQTTESTEAASPTRVDQPPFGRALAGAVGKLTLLACLPTLLALAARWHWSLDLLTHFRVWYVLALAAGAIVSLTFRQRKTALVAALVCGWNVALIAPFYLGGSPTEPVATAAMVGPPAEVAALAPSTSDSNTALRAMSINVLSSNLRTDDVVAVVREQQPDFVFFMEVDRRWMEALAELESMYPHRLDARRSDAFGAAFFSKLPPRRMEVVELSGIDLPSVSAELELPNGRTLSLLATHPLPPVGRARSAARNTQLAAAAEMVGAMSGPKMLLGDLNATGWSPYSADLLDVAGVRDSRHGFGVQGSWGPRRGLLSWLPRLPIDHILVSDEIEMIDHRIGPHIGSDHLPVTVDLRVRGVK
ncbi:MAG: hypothetical protein DWQ31_20590 [Planctomycetota bacterium]|nr:MAG: hypothetical protein DWQ31_20590 [Planctomycetota bacterium]